ncbi:hypothetical protein [Natronococcus jeotgali]|uniref:Uncharacterized protein n=1 Tax=Natronococcus jeotgali DSM 18795 TaxID=1227498 RepID=L9XPP5_9EURY|nr:hypothetical protein [Natronococcus jeotgali]ELY63406.1 hypothetical protein C492_07200 [Natronococcus jeotgali DSM 18795]
MPSDSESSRKQTFPSSVDLLSTLEACNIQYLDIDETRALVIYQTAILNLEGELAAASNIELEIYADPREDFSTESDEQDSSVIDSLLGQLASEDDRSLPDRN